MYIKTFRRKRSVPDKYLKFQLHFHCKTNCEKTTERKFGFIDEMNIDENIINATHAAQRCTFRFHFRSQFEESYSVVHRAQAIMQFSQLEARETEMEGEAKYIGKKYMYVRTCRAWRVQTRFFGGVNMRRNAHNQPTR